MSAALTYLSTKIFGARLSSLSGSSRPRPFDDAVHAHRGGLHNDGIAPAVGDDAQFLGVLVVGLRRIEIVEGISVAAAGGLFVKVLQLAATSAASAFFSTKERMIFSWASSVSSVATSCSMVFKIRFAGENHQRIGALVSGNLQRFLVSLPPGFVG